MLVDSDLNKLYESQPIGWIQPANDPMAQGSLMVTYEK